MKNILRAGLAFVSSLAAATTTITDTIYSTDGSLWNGTIYVRLNRTCTQSGTPLTPSTITVTVTSGALSQALEANDTCVPANTFYIVRYVSSAVSTPASATRNAFWRVPTSATAVTVASIETSTEGTPSVIVAASSIGGLTNTAVLFGGSGGAINQDVTNFNYLTSTKALQVGSSQFSFAAGSNITTGTVRAGSSQSTNNLLRFANSSNTTLSIIDSSGGFGAYSSGTKKMSHIGGTSQYASDGLIQFKDNSDLTAGSVDLSLSRSSGKLLVDNGAGTKKNIVAAAASAADEVLTRGSGSVSTDDCAKFDSSGRLVSAGAACGSGGGGGDVTAASSFGTDNRLIRSDGTGKGVQASGVTVDDSANISTAGTISTGGAEVATAASAYSTDNRLLRSDGTGRGTQASAITVDDSGNLSTAGTITSGSGVMGLLGTCRAPGSVSTPAASNYEFFCDSSNGDRWSSKDSSGTTVAYLKTGDASSGSGGGAANYEQSFTSQTSVTLAHSKNSTKVIAACYDGSNVEIIPNSVTLTDANNVTVAFSSSQTGKCVVNFAGSAKYSASFASTTSLSVAGTTHSLGTCDLAVTIYNNSSPAAIVIPDNVTCDSTSKDVTVTFASSQVGKVVLQ